MSIIYYEFNWVVTICLSWANDDPVKWLTRLTLLECKLRWWYIKALYWSDNSTPFPKSSQIDMIQGNAGHCFEVGLTAGVTEKKMLTVNYLRNSTPLWIFCIVSIRGLFCLDIAVEVWIQFSFFGTGCHSRCTSLVSP